MTTSLISGFTAKEAVVSTMAVLMNTSTANLGTALSGAFSTLSALSFLVFTLLYTPCVAAVATIKRELDSRIQTVGVVIMQCMVAWLCGCAVYQIGALYEYSRLDSGDTSASMGSGGGNKYIKAKEKR